TAPTGDRVSRPTSEIVLLMVGATVCLSVITTIVAVAVLAPSRGVNIEIVGLVYRVVDVMLGAAIGGIGVVAGTKAADRTEL
ncbi:MAG: hypothetical protein ACREJC_15740, partial [Tepidisphaeraceae bacterium]